MLPGWLGTVRELVAWVGGSATLIALGKWVWDQASGRNRRRVQKVRDAIDATQSEGRAWEAYWALRWWVIHTYGEVAGMPPAPEDPPDR